MREVLQNQKKILHGVAKNSAAIEDLGLALDAMCQSMKSMMTECKSHVSDDDFADLRGVIPIDSMEKFEEVEERLQEDASFKGTMVKSQQICLLFSLYFFY